MNKILKNILLLICIAGSIFLLNNLKEENNFERYFTTIDLKQNKEVIYEIDVGKMGKLKRYLQPEVFSLYLRLKNDNDLDNVSFRLDNLQALASQNSKKSEWKEIFQGEMLKSEKKKIILNLDIYIPDNPNKVYCFNQGKILITNNDKVVKEIKIKFIDSQYK